ncbi:hypothetical protein JW890_06130 [candidate division WOR-3 bacterium]|nr:hypothetical protein [candidate division WOR-3 bacterium]
MDELKTGLVKFVFDKGRELFVQKRFVTEEEYSIFKPAKTDLYSSPSDKGGKGFAFDVSFIEAANYCNLLSELDGYRHAYDISSNPVNPVNLDSEGYRLFTLGEWEELLKVQIMAEKEEVEFLKGVYWQLTETEISLPHKPDGSSDPEHPEFIWSYRVAVGGSADSSEKLLSGKPLSLLLGYEGNYRTCFRIVRGNAEQNAWSRNIFSF